MNDLSFSEGGSEKSRMNSGKAQFQSPLQHSFISLDPF